VESPSTSDYNQLIFLLNDINQRLVTIEGQGFVNSVTGVNGILTIKNGNTYEIDGSAVLESYRTEIQEVVFYHGGIILLDSGLGRWYPWNDVNILGIKLSVGSPPLGSPLVVDVNKNGETIFTNQTNRPTINDSQYTSQIVFPDTFNLTPSDYLSIDVDNIGLTSPGSDVTIQIRYQELT
jgi:hypothetical protein